MSEYNMAISLSSKRIKEPRRVCSIKNLHNLLEECNPDEYFSFETKELIPGIEECDPEMADEVKGWVNCTSSWLRRYMKFATGCMTDHELGKFYSDTLDMIDDGIRSRKWQKELVEEELMEAEELYSNEVLSDEDYDEIKWAAEETKRSLDEDADELKKLKSFCLTAKDRIGVVQCIERVATAAHSRGSMLPVMCGAYLPEDIIPYVKGWERNYECTRPEDVGLELSKTVPRILECVKEYR